MSLVSGSASSAAMLIVNTGKAANASGKDGSRVRLTSASFSSEDDSIMVGSPPGWKQAPLNDSQIMEIYYSNLQISKK